METNQSTIIQCPNVECKQKLRVPIEQGTLQVTCPKCKSRFTYRPEEPNNMGLFSKLFGKRRMDPLAVYVCDLCGRRFNRQQLDKHFVKTARQAERILGIDWSGKVVTFSKDGKAWCPHCFKDARSMRHGTKTVHEGERKPYLRQPNIGITYTCKCGAGLSFSCRSVNIFTGLRVQCDRCGAILFVPPTIFDHSSFWPQGDGASLRDDYLDQLELLADEKTEMKYFEVPRPSGDRVCSDPACPCSEVKIPCGTGYLYISQEVVDFRQDCLDASSHESKLQRIEQAAGKETVVIWDRTPGIPILMCEQGARLRNLDLKRAAMDAKYWWETGRAPLRVTPLAGSKKAKGKEKGVQEHEADESFREAERAAHARDWTAAFEHLKATLNLRPDHQGAIQLMNWAYCPHCNVFVSEPSTTHSTVEFARFCRGLCPACSGQMVLRKIK